MGTREYMLEDPSLPGRATSPWLASAPETRYPPLRGRAEADVAVVGGGRLPQPPLRDRQSLRPDEGAVVAYGRRVTAAYRDREGTLERLDPVRRHLGCQVTWNEAEKTWACPCHGSRYAQDGSALYAPTRAPLLPADRWPEA